MVTKMKYKRKSDCSFRTRRFLKTKGFTLIEILVVISILAIIVAIGSMSFFGLLKGSRKSKTMTLVKQNGNYALGVMAKMVRNAREVTSICGGSDDSITILNPDGNETTFDCGSETISSNSANIVSDQVRIDPGSCSFDCQSGGLVYPDVVTISFTLKQAGDPTRPEEQASIDFETRVTLRNVGD